MNHKDFENSPAGRVIKAGQGDAAYWAFIPNPLPPGLSRLGIDRLLSEADRALSELGGPDAHCQPRFIGLPIFAPRGCTFLAHRRDTIGHHRFVFLRSETIGLAA